MRSTAGRTSEPSATVEPALNPAVLDSLRQLGRDAEPDVLQEVLGIFLLDAPTRLEAIRRALRDRDGDALRRAAHALKGASAVIGATALAAACLALENMGKQNAFDAAAEGLDVTEREYQRVKAEIDQLL